MSELPGPTPKQMAATFMAWRKLPPTQREGILAAMLREVLAANLQHSQAEPSTPARPKLRIVRGEPMQPQPEPQYSPEAARELLDRLGRLEPYRREQVWDVWIRALALGERSAQRDANREPEACKICNGTGRDPMSDDANWLTCSHCGGSGQEPAGRSFDPASRGDRG